MSEEKRELERIVTEFMGWLSARYSTDKELALTTQDIEKIDAVVNEIVETRTTQELVPIDEIEKIHNLLDNDASKIIRNSKDGYPEGRPDKVLSLYERVKALCLYASDWKRWCEASKPIELDEEKVEALVSQEVLLFNKRLDAVQVSLVDEKIRGFWKRVSKAICQNINELRKDYVEPIYHNNHYDLRKDTNEKV